MPVTWLHVSDFHFQAADSYDRSVVLKALVAAVGRFYKQGRRPDLIFATGDIGHSGQPGDYQSVGRFFDDLLHAAGVEKRRLFVVPGNHDVDRGRGKGLDRTLKSEDADEYFAPGEPKVHIEKKMRAFVTWYNGYFNTIRSFPEDTTCGPSELAVVNGFRIAVLPLNSALFCCGDDDHAKLWLGHRCLKAAVDTLKSHDADLTLALIHHPLDWLAGEEAGRVKVTLAGAVDVLLRGHLHENEAGLWATTDGTTLHLAAGAAYQTRQYPNRALYVMVDRGEATIHPIHYVDNPHEVWVLDTGCFPTGPNYEGVLAIPRRAGSRAAPNSGAIDPPPQPATSENRRIDSERRFLALKARVRELLLKSEAAHDAVARRMPPAESPDRTNDKHAELVNRLIALTFVDGKTVLLNAHDDLRRSDNKAGLAALGTISRLLVPWLYVASNNLVTKKWESVALGEVVNLPIGIETFAELIMAGIDRRELAFQAISSTDWPPPAPAVSLHQPETGMIDGTEQNLRDDLFRRVIPAPDFARSSAGIKDRAINQRLEHFVTRKGLRHYLLCHNREGNDEDRAVYRDLLTRIAGRYPALAVVELKPDWALHHQALFDEIRDLLMPNLEPA